MIKHKIAIILKGSHSWIGGREYFENLILALGALRPDDKSFDIYVFSEEKLSSRVQPHVIKTYNKQSMPPLNIIGRIFRMIYKLLSVNNEVYFNYALRKEKINFLYPFFHSDKKIESYKSAAWIEDFQHKHLPEFFHPNEILSRDNDFLEITNKAEKVILSSRGAEKDCHKYYPESIGKTHVLPFCVVPESEWYDGDVLKVQNKYNLPDKFFIVCNQFWQHKNHLLVFKALHELKNKSIKPIIVFTGHIYDYRRPEFSDSILSSIHELGISKQVIILGLIPKQDQIQLIRRSIAVIQPSLFEGWSTIVELARCFGKTTILSDLTVHHEQQLPNGVFFSRDSVDQLAEKLTTSWEELSIGPDMESEKKAFSLQSEKIVNFGKRFLEISRVS